MHQKLLVGLVGRGIQRSLSPALHEAEAEHYALRLHYQLIDLDATQTSDSLLPTIVSAMPAMGFSGFNVTFPFKQAIIPMLHALSAEAEAVGAVNTVVVKEGRLSGHNTDGSGWAWGFTRALPKADLSSVVQLGAGGAGSAVADAVLRLGARKLTLVDSDHARACALADRLNAVHRDQRASAERDVARATASATGLIHTTPTGMNKFPGMPIAEDLLRADMWVSEIVYLPLETPLLTAARRRGCATADGCWMTVGQAVGAFQLFTGRAPDAMRMNTHLRSLIAR
jgi:shikimate dehydrogenase